MRPDPTTRASRRTPNPLVLLRSGTGCATVYCFHPFGGSAAVYGELALRLAPTVGVCGLQAVGLTAGVPPDRSVRQLAHRYAAAIRATRPNGCTVLLGYSMGGLLAVETARLLRELLPAAPVVVVIDSDPAYELGTGGAWQILAREVLDLDLPTEPLARMPRQEALAAIRTAAAAQRRLPARFSLAQLDRMAQVCHANALAAANHHPRPYPDTVHSIRASGVGGQRRDSWATVARRVVPHLVAADHHTVLTAVGAGEVADRVRLLSAPPTPPVL